MSIRARLAIAVAIVLALTLLLLGGVMVRTTRATLVAQVDDELRSFTERARKDSPGLSKDDGGGQFGRKNDYVHMVVSADGAILGAEYSGYPGERESPPVVPDLATGTSAQKLGRIFTVPSRDGSFQYRMLITPMPDNRLRITASSIRDIEEASAPCPDRPGHRPDRDGDRDVGLLVPDQARLAAGGPDGQHGVRDRRW